MQEGIFCGKQNDFRGPTNGHKQCFGANVGKKIRLGESSTNCAIRPSSNHDSKHSICHQMTQTLYFAALLATVEKIAWRT